MNSCELVTLISTIACAIAKDKSIEELNFLSVLFTQLGDTLTTIAVNNESIVNCNFNKKHYNSKNDDNDKTLNSYKLI